MQDSLSSGPEMIINNRGIAPDDSLIEVDPLPIPVSYIFMIANRSTSLHLKYIF